MSEIERGLKRLQERVESQPGSHPEGHGERGGPIASGFDTGDADRVLESFGFDPEDFYQWRERMIKGPVATILHGESPVLVMQHVWGSGVLLGLVIAEMRREGQEARKPA